MAEYDVTMKPLRAARIAAMSSGSFAAGSSGGVPAALADIVAVVFFAALLFFVLVVLLHYATVISRLSDQNTILAQKLALLEEKLRSHSEEE